MKSDTKLQSKLQSKLHTMLHATVRIVGLSLGLTMGCAALNLTHAASAAPECGSAPAPGAVAGAAGVALPARDWNQAPVVVQLDTSHDLYAIGDAHGDPLRLGGVLLAAKLIPALPTKSGDVKWAAGKAVLVVTGDLIDKYNQGLEVIALLRALQADAASKGGRVIITMGNHEAEFLADPLGKKTRLFCDELNAANIDPLATAMCQTDIGAFLCQLPIAARVNDWFFSHGGNTKNQTIAELSQSIQEGFKQEGFATKKLVGDNSILEARLNEKGPGKLPWIFDKDAKSNPQKLLQKYAKALGVNHMVQGHQYGKLDFLDGTKRKKKEFFQRYGVYFLIDTAMSRGIGTAMDEDDDPNPDSNTYSLGGALYISGPTGAQTATVMCANGTQTKLWDSKKNQDSKAQVCGE